MTGSTMIGEMDQKNSRFKVVDDFEAYINAIDVDYDSEEIIVRGWLYKSNTSEFDKLNRSQYDKGTDFRQDIVEYIGNNCYIPLSGNCFTKCINHLTGKDYMNEFYIFIRNE